MDHQAQSHHETGEKAVIVESGDVTCNLKVELDDVIAVLMEEAGFDPEADCIHNEGNAELQRRTNTWTLY